MSDEVIARLGEGTLTAANDPDSGQRSGEGGSFRNGKHESIGARDARSIRQTTAVEMIGIWKEFPGVLAGRGINLEVRPQEIHS